MTYDSFHILSDVGHVFTAKAAGAITGGFLVSWNSGTNVVTTGAQTYAYDDIAVVENTDTSRLNCMGMALGGITASGTEVAILMQGIVILPAGSGGVSGGMPVVPVGYGGAMVEFLRPGSVATTEYPIGRALSTASNQSNFAIVRLDV